MPSYFYHIKLELYPTPDPASAAGTFDSLSDNIWLPLPSTDIFDTLPSHPLKNKSKSRRALPTRSHPLPSRISAASRQTDGQRAGATQNQPSAAGVIDCGPARVAPEDEDDSNVEILSERQWKARTQSFPVPLATAAIRPDAAVKDWRFGRVRIESFDEASDDREYQQMATDGPGSASHAASGIGPTYTSGGRPTKAKYVPAETRNTEAGWGIVHFYREQEETPGLRLPPPTNGDGGVKEEEDCTILCIPAVPSYMMPRDLLGFIGHQWREGISHYRLVMTAQMNQYLVLLKFHTSQRARQWQKEFDGKPLSDVGQVCQVVFVRSVTFETPPTRPDGHFPDLSRDPFTPSSSTAVSNTLRPFPPPTPNLIELPTCAVCLERMDDTTGLMTIACQHVFHCTCLEGWRGSGCPICRHTNDASDPYSQPFGGPVSNLCCVCDTPDDLWVCLICGRVGCGRYKGGHAKDHWKETAHCFALELETQHVWDYAGDTWVHRLIREKGEGKVVELPGTTANGPGGAGHHHGRGGGGGGGGGEDDEDVVPRAKLDNIGREYSHLLTSQLESQRVYFEEMISKIADKAANASAAAEANGREIEALRADNGSMRAELTRLREETVPQLERDLARESARADKAQELARKMGKAVQEEKEMTKGLMKRVEHSDEVVRTLREADGELKAKIADLEDMNRDLTMFISGQEKLKELENEGKVEAGELAEGSASVPEKKGRRKGKR